MTFKPTQEEVDTYNESTHRKINKYDFGAMIKLANMDRKQKIDAIYEIFAFKWLWDGCIVLAKECIEDRVSIDEYFVTCHKILWEHSLWVDIRSGSWIYRVTKIIGHPVRIGDILAELDDWEHWPFMVQVWKIIDLWQNFRKPIELQPDYCIDYIYSLISK